MESPFEVLGVEPGADEETVEQAYRRRVKESHPDGGGTAEEFQRVREAYEAVVAGEATPPEEALEEEDRDTTDEPASRGAGPRRRPTEPGPDEPGTRAPGAGAGAGANARPSRREDPGDDLEEVRVEYLDYEVVEDHGWALGDDDLFEKAADANVDPDDYGRFLADPDEMLLEAAEAQGYGWPFACRGGACANCAVYVSEGAVEDTVDHVLSDELYDAGFRLSCICKPASEVVKVVYNVKHLPGLEEFRLPATRFEKAWSDD